MFVAYSHTATVHCGLQPLLIWCKEQSQLKPGCGELQGLWSADPTRAQTHTHRTFANRVCKLSTQVSLTAELKRVPHGVLDILHVQQQLPTGHAMTARSY